MDQFESKVLDVRVGRIDESRGGIEVATESEWQDIRARYLDSEYNAECDAITRNNSLVRKMGSSCQVICLLGSQQSLFGESILHLTGMWLDKCDNACGDGDRILVLGKNITQMGAVTGTGSNDGQQAF